MEAAKKAIIDLSHQWGYCKSLNTFSIKNNFKKCSKKDEFILYTAENLKARPKK
jgi:hypothetical protein